VALSFSDLRKISMKKIKIVLLFLWICLTVFLILKVIFQDLEIQGLKTILIECRKKL